MSLEKQRGGPGVDYEVFAREQEYHYLRSVRDAAAAAWEQTAGRRADEAYVALATELLRRGIEPDPGAVYAGASLISSGKQPPILRPGGGRRSRLGAQS